MRSALRWIPAVAVLALPFSARAQAASTVSWGLIGGLNLSTVSGDDLGDSKELKMGLALGITMQKPINPMWTFNGEAHWTMKGVKAKEGATEGSVKLSYIEVPLLFRGMSESGEVRPFIEFGAAPALKLSCDFELKSNGVTASTDCDGDDDGDEIKSFDLGLVGGAGIQWMAMGRPWTLGARYTMGMMKLSENGDSKNTNIQFLLGFRFR